MIVLWIFGMVETQTSP